MSIYMVDICNHLDVYVYIYNTILYFLYHLELHSGRMAITHYYKWLGRVAQKLILGLL